MWRGLWWGLCIGSLFCPAFGASAQIAGSAPGPGGSVLIQPILPTGAQPSEQPAAGGGPQVRIKDIARFLEVRSNQLVGLGLVVGLDGTGDGSRGAANVQMVANMLRRFGVVVDPEQLRLRNAAAVTVTAELPPFARPGDRIDVTVSSFGDARSLQGGLLLQTPLQAADGEVYAVAQGPISIGGYNVRAGGSRLQENHPLTARIVDGAIVERQVPFDVAPDGELTLVLSEPDFTTASRVSEVINRTFVAGTARALDPAAIRIEMPPAFASDPVRFMAAIEELPVVPDAVARVVVNERTGTVALGGDVRIATVAVAHGNLRVRVEPEIAVSQPPFGSEGETVVTRTDRLGADEEAARFMVLPAGTSVAQLVEALNTIGATPRDVVAILQAVKAAGALYGELVLI
ncbi:MAG TPA: flagellar basal body P-ring protein FlgI [Limnochordia bacterium]